MAVTGAVVVSAHADSDADHRSGSPMTPYDEIVDELYGLAPAAFVTRRNELARELKANGDRDLAGRIAKLRRPTQAAWAINQWVRAHPDDSALIAGLASDLTAAQRRSAVDKMKTLSRRRQDLINDSVTAVAATAADLRVTLGDSTIREVTQTLRAAVADPEVLEQVLRGNLTASAEYSGFGPAGVFVVPEPLQEPVADESGASGADADGADEEGADRDDADDSDHTASDEAERRRRDLEARLAEAETGERTARSDLDAASRTVDGASSEVDEIVRRAQELRAELARCEESLRFARQRLSTAEQGRAEARIALREAVAATNEIRSALAEL